jgi:hypothetical protein
MEIESSNFQFPRYGSRHPWNLRSPATVFRFGFHVAGFFVVRWLFERRRRRTQHRVVQYMCSLFEIEQRQLTLDRIADADDIGELQGLLHEITLLRQRAFDHFSSHDLKTDGSLYTFIEMCNKIIAKISRLRHDQRFAKLSQALDRSRRQN